jgi:hypothetical protein
MNTENVSNELKGNELNPVLYAVFSSEFDNWEKNNNPSFCFIDNGRTIPYDFHSMCTTLWGEINHTNNHWFEMFREQMLNTATNWQDDLKQSLWGVVCWFHQNSV